ncbi:MAG: hypothetical protein U5R46_03245 [Gammaproteobacteria bacterium]|nr:hypothetical protein [Gammaproteobacteria bacterium]
MKAIQYLLAAVLWTALQAAALAQDSYKVYLTAKADAEVPLQEPMETFTCSDRIYGVLEVNQPDGGSGTHTLHATWRNPAGDDQEVTRYDFQITNGYARVWVWLKLNRSGEAAIVQFINPTAGMEEFIGMWELHVRVDGESVAKKTFEVLC